MTWNINDRNFGWWKLFLFYWCKITPIHINDSESQMPQFSWGEGGGGGGGPYTGYMDAKVFDVILFFNTAKNKLLLHKHQWNTRWASDIPTLPIWSGVSRFDVLPPALPIFIRFSRFIIKFWKEEKNCLSYKYFLRSECKTLRITLITLLCCC